MKISYLKDDVDVVAKHFKTCSRQVVSLALRTYTNDTDVYKKLKKAELVAKIMKIQDKIDLL